MNIRRASMVDKMIAERVPAFRKQQGLTQGELAQRLGVTFQQVQKYEMGTNRIGAGRLYEIARIFDLPVQAFYPESDEDILHAGKRTDEFKAIMDFVGSNSGWRLCRSFLNIADPGTRRGIIALVQEIAGSQCDRATGRHPSVPL